MNQSLRAENSHIIPYVELEHFTCKNDHSTGATMIFHEHLFICEIRGLYAKVNFAHEIVESQYHMHVK